MRWTLVADDSPLITLADEVPTEPAEVGAGRFHAVLIVEDTWSGDGRFVSTDALTWRDLPVPLMGLDSTTEAHQEAVVIGSIDKIEREGIELHGYGPWAVTPEANSIRELVRAGHLTGVSADLDDVEFEIIFPEDDELGLLLAAAGDRGDGDVEGEAVPIHDPKLRVTSGRIMGATVVPFPAFAECFIEDVSPEVNLASLVAGAVGPHDTGITDDPWDGAAEEGKLTQPMAIATARAMYAWIEDGVDEADVPKTSAKFPHHMVGDNGAPGVANSHALAAVVAALNGGRGGSGIADADRQGVYDHIAKHYTDNDLEPPELASIDLDDTVVAAAVPIDPPRAWFDPPGLDGYTPLTITDAGRIVGHAADWQSCHISFPDRCVPPPHSASNYAHFHTGEVRCSDGSRVAVGHLSVKGGHAGLELSAAAAKAYYDDTRSCIADVVCGEDRYGIWVAGALRPNVDPADVRVAMASGVSGDWRRLGGSLELIQLASVNVPGFLKPRTRIRESAGLVAAVIAELPPVTPDAGVLDRAVDRLASTIGRSTAQRRAALYRRVHPSLGNAR